ncbi:MAG: HU family DNA-binding protein [Bacteroidaceae bacterium]|nr:HU family DNA-binding protein [Bacteroidaceae bacterium]
MNNKEFISALSQKEGLLQRDAQKMVNLLVAELSAQFENGNTLTVQNFGQFEVKKKLERVVVNPSSGQRMLVPPKLVLNFKAYPALKERTQKGGEA